MAESDRGYDDVRIRDVEDADLAIFFEHQRDPQAARMAAFAARARQPFFAHWAEIRASQAIFVQAVVVNGEVAGNIMSWEQYGQRQVGYWIGRRHWGRGVATTALALFLCRMTSRPVHAYVAVHNAGSIRVLEKCGFQRVADRGGPSPTGDSGEHGLVEHVLES